MMLKKTLKEKITEKLGDDFGPLPDFAVSVPPPGVEGDFAVNLPLLLAGNLKVSPPEIARRLAERLSDGVAEIKKVSVAGGFVNVTLDDSALFGALSSAGDAPRSTRPKKILVEFVSSNPTGPLHIGHGRCAAIGDSLARLFEIMGHRVEREYYVNDAGNQMKSLAESVAARAAEIKGLKNDFPEHGYKGDYIRDIAREAVDGGRSDYGEFACRRIMESTEYDLAAFRVKMDRYFSETSLAPKVAAILDDLAARGYARESEGALWFAPPSAENTDDNKDEERVLRKRTGELTYFASDVAYHADKYARGYDEIINVWGADHHGYAPRIRNAVAALGLDPSKLRIILYQLVSLKRGGKKIAMSTRAGEFVTLRGIIDEAGADAARFFLLARAPGSPVEFDVDLAKKHSSENPVFYVQYAHARISSVFAQAVRVGADVSSAVPGAPGLSGEEAERELAKSLLTLGDTFDLCAREYTTHHITSHLLDIARRLHNFYERCRVLSDDRRLTVARLGLLAAARKSLKSGLWALGVEAPDKM